MGNFKHSIHLNEHKHRRVQFLPWNMVLNVLIFLSECLRTIVLTLLLWFRPLLFLVCRPLSGLMLIAFIICLFSHPHDHRLTYGFGLFSFSAFLILDVQVFKLRKTAGKRVS